MGKRIFYAAYGSNLNRSVMLQNCPSAKQIGTTILEGWCLSFRGLLTIQPREGRKVPLGIWSIDTEDEYMLDRYEGAPKVYSKETMTLDVQTENGVEQLSCLIYIMNADVNYGSSVSANYYNRCVEGYREFGFDERYLEDALARREEWEFEKFVAELHRWEQARCNE